MSTKGMNHDTYSNHMTLVMRWSLSDNTDDNDDDVVILLTKHPIYTTNEWYDTTLITYLLLSKVTGEK